MAIIRSKYEKILLSTHIALFTFLIIMQFVKFHGFAKIIGKGFCIEYVVGIILWHVYHKFKKKDFLNSAG